MPYFLASKDPQHLLCYILSFRPSHRTSPDPRREKETLLLGGGCCKQYMPYLTTENQSFKKGVQAFKELNEGQLMDMGTLARDKMNQGNLKISFKYLQGNHNEGRIDLDREKNLRAGVFFLM